MSIRTECGMGGANIVIATCDHCGATAEAEYDRAAGFDAQARAEDQAWDALSCSAQCDCEACVRLSDAAPDLLAACKALVEENNELRRMLAEKTGITMTDHAAREQAHVAIDKAVGG